jgi:hypothetical protein
MWRFGRVAMTRTGPNDTSGLSETPYQHYGLASEEGQNIFLTDSVPEGFTLSDPDHINADKINKLYNHWLSRQNEGLPPFVVLNSSPNHASDEMKSKKSEKAKGKQKAKYVDVNSDEDGDVDLEGELDKETDEELRDNDEVEERVG